MQIQALLKFSNSPVRMQSRKQKTANADDRREKLALTCGGHVNYGDILLVSQEIKNNPREAK